MRRNRNRSTDLGLSTPSPKVGQKYPDRQISASASASYGAAPAPAPGLEQWLDAAPEGGGSLQVTVLYEEGQTRKWAKGMTDHLANVAGPAAVQATWWKLSDLRTPGVMAGAISMALRADLILVAVRRSEGLPLPFYVWVESWLPYRKRGTGALVAALGTPASAAPESSRLQKYLRSVVAEARMHLVISERFTDASAEADPAADA